MLGISIARGEKIVPRAGRQEAVVEDDGGVGDGANLTVGIAVELADCGFGEGGDEGFVEDLDANYDVLVGRLGVFLCDGGEDGERLGDRGAARPGWFSKALAGVVETVLGPGRAVEVDYYLEV